MENIGWISAILLGTCCIPYATKKRTIDLFFAIWYIGEITGLIYVVFTGKGWPLITNYMFNTLVLTFVLWRNK